MCAFTKITAKGEWIPTKASIEWLAKLVDVLKKDGVWVLPSYGITFKKTAEKTLTLDRISMIPTDVQKEIINRTVEIGKKAGIKVIIFES